MVIQVPSKAKVAKFSKIFQELSKAAKTWRKIAQSCQSLAKVAKKIAKSCQRIPKWQKILKVPERMTKNLSLHDI